MKTIQEIYEERLHEYERVHAEYMNTPVTQMTPEQKTEMQMAGNALEEVAVIKLQIGRLDAIVKKNTGFPDFQSLLDARGGYWPSLNVSKPEILELADAYDAAQKLRGDTRKAFRFD